MQDILKKVEMSKDYWEPIFSGESRAVVQKVIGKIVFALREQPAPIDRTLGAGGAGIALLFAYLRKAGFQNTDYCSPVDNDVIYSTGKPLDLTVFPSLYQGISGVLWAEKHTQYNLISIEPQVIAGAIDSLKSSLERKQWTTHYDLITGVIGLGVFALERPEEPACRNLVEAIVAWLSQTAEHHPDGITWRTPADFVFEETGVRTNHAVYNLGIAHGVPGIIAFLAKAYSFNIGRDRAMALIPGAVDWLMSHQLASSNRFRFPHFVGKDVGANSTGLAWCYGVLGIAATLHFVGRCFDETQWQTKALEFACDAAREPVDTRFIEPGLCHGASGIGHIFNRLYQASSEPALRVAAQSWLEGTIGLRCSGEGIAGFLTPEFGVGEISACRADSSFLTGAAGIGLALLASVTHIEPKWDAALLISGAATPSSPSHGSEKGINSDSDRWSFRVEQRHSNPDPCKPAGFFVLRTPLLPYDCLKQLTVELASPIALESSGDLIAAITCDQRETERLLKETLELPTVREAVWLASPGLYTRLQSWQADSSHAVNHRFTRTLVRYFTRMTSRPTPFGLFAGCSVGRIATRTNLTLGSSSDYRKKTTLDLAVLQHISWSLSHDDSFRDRMNFRVNSTLYRSGGKFVFLASRGPNEGDGAELVLVEATDHLKCIINAVGTCLSFSDIRKLLETKDLDRKATDAFVHEIIDAQILLPDIDPFVTGPDALKALIKDLQRVSIADDLTLSLQFVADEIARLDRAGIGTNPSDYEPLLVSLRQIPMLDSLKYPLHTTLVKSSPMATLGSDVLDSLTQGIKALQHINFELRNDPLRDLRDAFYRKYGTNAVRLTDLFQPETGVTPLLQGLDFSTSSGRTPSWTRRDDYLLRKLERVWANGSNTMILDEAELSALSEGALAPLPEAFFVLATVLDSSSDHAHCCRTLLHAVGGPSGTAILGRFCDADPKLHEAVRDLLAQEEALFPNAQFAEIVYLPAGRAGNVVRRPVLRDYEIIITGRSGAESDRQLHLTDLFVSLNGDRFQLWSASLKCEIIPRLANAHVASSNLPTFYRFLSQLQFQGTVDALVWDWGAFENSQRLPRVIVGNAILARAQWKVRPTEINFNKTTSDVELYEKVQAWRQTRQIPRYVTLVENATELFVDMLNIVSLKSLMNIIIENSSVILMEVLDGPHGCAVSGPEGGYTNEVVVPFLSIRPSLTELHQNVTDINANISCNFTLGSDWLSVSIYTNIVQAEYLIEEVLAPLALKLQRMKHVDRWFFIRYGDPDWHVRIRFHGKPEQILNHALPEVRNVLEHSLQEGYIYRVTYDTYQREIERYGGQVGIELAERIFHADSEAVVSLLLLIRKAGTEDYRWRLAILGLDVLLDDFGFSTPAKLELAEDLERGLGLELGRDARLSREIADKYRAKRQDLNALLTISSEDDEIVSAARLILEQRSDRNRIIMAMVHQERLNRRIGRPLGELAASYAHMFANRILRESHRAQELVLYSFLTRLYRSQLAQKW